MFSQYYRNDCSFIHQSFKKIDWTTKKNLWHHFFFILIFLQARHSSNMEFTSETVHDVFKKYLFDSGQLIMVFKNSKLLPQESSIMSESFHWESMEPACECVVDILNQKIILPLWISLQTNKQIIDVTLFTLRLRVSFSP